jgi:hypothetical protein
MLVLQTIELGSPCFRIDKLMREATPMRKRIAIRLPSTMGRVSILFRESTTTLKGNRGIGLLLKLELLSGGMVLTVRRLRLSVEGKGLC